ncbi:hypothetical protein [Pantoea vagans]|uniref:hypothetical protein n=1 Tax=Pantoea vagans TaxID=470934 RepID=UPI00301ABBE2
MNLRQCGYDSQPVSGLLKELTVSKRRNSRIINSSAVAESVVADDLAMYVAGFAIRDGRTPAAATRAASAFSKRRAASQAGHAAAGPHGYKWRLCARIGLLCDIVFPNAEKAELKKLTQSGKDEG